MGINRVTKRGKTRIEVRKRWPDGTTYRRYSPNMTTAKQTLTEIEASIVRGTWEEYRQSLTSTETESSLTIREFADIYLDKYCAKYNRRPDFKKHALQPVIRLVGDVPLKEFGISSADTFVAERIRRVTPATVNRGIAVLKNMLSFAVREKQIEKNPLAGFKMLPEEEVPLRILTLQQERLVVESAGN